MYDVTPNICMISYVLYWHHIDSISDFIFTVSMTTPIIWHHHNHSIYDITSTIYMTSHPLIYNVTPIIFFTSTISVTPLTISIIKPTIINGLTSTIYDINWLFMKSYPLYMWLLTHRSMRSQLLYPRRHTPLFMTSHPLHIMLQTLFMMSQKQHDILFLTCDVMPSITMMSRPMFLWHHIHYIFDIAYTPTVFMTKYLLYTTSLPLYIISHPLYM